MVSLLSPFTRVPEFLKNSQSCNFGECFQSTGSGRTDWILFSGVNVVMQHQQIEVVPGESVRVGNMIVTVLYVEGGEVTLKIDDPDNAIWTDPADSFDYELSELAAI